MKSFFEDFVGGMHEGMRDGFQFSLALIAAPFVVFIEFVTSTGRWAPRQDDTSMDSARDRTEA
jgi:hypothetical protein